MFSVCVCEETFPIPYHFLRLDKHGSFTAPDGVLVDTIAHTYNDKVLPNVGLLVELFDIVKACECKSLPDAKCAYLKVFFRYVVFNPPIGSVWEGQIMSENDEGIGLRLSFFGDIWVPWPNLPANSEFKSSEETWVWYYQDDDEEYPPYYFDVGDDVRFRICEVRFSKPGDKAPPMQVIASMGTPGLGPKRWWSNKESGL